MGKSRYNGSIFLFVLLLSGDLVQSNTSEKGEDGPTLKPGSSTKTLETSEPNPDGTATTATDYRVETDMKNEDSTERNLSGKENEDISPHYVGDEMGHESANHHTLSQMALRNSHDDVCVYDAPSEPCPKDILFRHQQKMCEIFKILEINATNLLAVYKNDGDYEEFKPTNAPSPDDENSGHCMMKLLPDVRHLNTFLHSLDLDQFPNARDISQVADEDNVPEPIINADNSDGSSKSNYDANLEDKRDILIKHFDIHLENHLSMIQRYSAALGHLQLDQLLNDPKNNELLGSFEYLSLKFNNLLDNFREIIDYCGRIPCVSSVEKIVECKYIRFSDDDANSRAYRTVGQIVEGLHYFSTMCTLLE